MEKKIFREYLSFVGQGDKKEQRVTNAGYSKVLPGTTYPEKNHPSEYFFTWEKGRILHEYQLILITEGEGEFESSSSGRIEVRPGALITIFKNEWHRYRPN